MKKLSLIFVIVITALPVFAQRTKDKPDKRLTGLDSGLEALLTDWHVPGYAVAVIEKDKVVYSKGFGYRDLENLKPVTSKTLFPIASCSKAFTSALLGILNEDNRIDLNETPGKYIPGLKFYNDEMDSYVTVADLMCHRTGLPRHDPAWKLFPTFSSDTLLSRIQFQKPTAHIRQRYQYNNLMFFLQGRIVENVTSKSWGQNISERIFYPLEMIRSNVSIKDLTMDDDATTGYRLNSDSETVKMNFFEMGAVAACGGINSCVDEMANWLIAWINGGKFKGKQVIPESYLKQAISSQMVSEAGLPSELGPDMHMSTYGYAWMLSSYRGHYKVGHSGNIDGSSALIAFYPTDSIGIVILTNQYSSGVRQVVMNIISDMMLNLPAREWNKILLAERDKQYQKQKDEEAKPDTVWKAGTSPSHKSEDYLGTYSNPAYGELRLIAENDSLFALFPRDRFWLRHYHYDVFKMLESNPSGNETNSSNVMKINFIGNEKGEIDGLYFKTEPTLEPQYFRKQVKNQ